MEEVPKSRCSFCKRNTPIWELKENDGECNHCSSMDYIERQALIADEEVIRNDFRSAYTM